MSERATAGQVAYTAYCFAVGGKTHDNRPLPTWQQLGDVQRAGWDAAAKAVRGK